VSKKRERCCVREKAKEEEERGEEEEEKFQPLSLSLARARAFHANRRKKRTNNARTVIPSAGFFCKSLICFTMAFTVAVDKCSIFSSSSSSSSPLLSL
jgi:hypothetical protein